MSKDWLESVKPGDYVIVRGQYGVGRSVGRIGRLTKTRIMISLPHGGVLSHVIETAFRRSDGGEVGANSYNRRQLEEGTPEVIEAVRKSSRKAKLAQALGHRNWENVSLEVLEAITLLLTEAPKDV